MDVYICMHMSYTHIYIYIQVQDVDRCGRVIYGRLYLGSLVASRLYLKEDQNWDKLTNKNFAMFERHHLFEFDIPGL